MIALDSDTRDAPLRALAARLLGRRAASDHWEGYLSSSALSTGTAVLALHLFVRARTGRQPGARAAAIVHGIRWLIQHQNADGGWGDTVRSRSNISTTAIVWASLSATGDAAADLCLSRAEAWLHAAAGGTSPAALRSAILRRYGKDQTFSVPILTVLALAGKLGDDTRAAWRSVPQLPFELAALPHRWFARLKLPVVSYALPALIAIGQVRHRAAPSRNLVARLLRDGVTERTLRVLLEMQPESGGYLEATPLTSFVVMSLTGAGRADHAVAEAGVRFLLDSIRDDGSWPIDTNLATWVTTLSIGALAGAEALPAEDAAAMRGWLLRQQTDREHPFTHAAAGAWAWTPLSGGVPDADDTSGALVALRLLAEPDPTTITAAAAGARWLLGVQNRDGGIPTFCRGWGTLPFDRSTPEITAHALRAWSAWHSHFDQSLQQALREAALRGLTYLARTQREDGTWVPLWFGNERARDEENPVYGTARVISGLTADLVCDLPRARQSLTRAVEWLLAAQSDDGGWGGHHGVPSSIEETGVALGALGRVPKANTPAATSDAIARGSQWLATVLERADSTAAPIGLYFARLWYYEELYPLIFALEGLGAGRLTAQTQRP